MTRREGRRAEVVIVVIKTLSQTKTSRQRKSADDRSGVKAIRCQDLSQREPLVGETVLTVAAHPVRRGQQAGKHGAMRRQGRGYVRISPLEENAPLGQRGHGRGGLGAVTVSRKMVGPRGVK